VYDGYQYPTWAEGVGWLLAMAVITMIPLCAGVTVYRSIGSCQALGWLIRSPASVAALNLRDVIGPGADWGPALASNQHRPHQSVRGYHWLYMIPSLFGLQRRSSSGVAVLPPGDSCLSVAYHEGHCFVTDTSYYHRSTADDDTHRY